MRNQYLRMASSLYVNYLLLGMTNIILPSSMSFLSEQFHTDSTGISFLISAKGIGQLVTLSVSGKLSDKFGRKPLVAAAPFLYFIFLIGIPLAPNFQTAFVFAFIAGMGNSIMDSGTYPALIEAFPKKAGSATVLLKAFVSIGATFLPIIMAFFIAQDMFYGYTFFVPAVLFLINGLFSWTATFPNHKAGEYDHYLVDYGTTSKKYSIEPKFWREGIGTILIGFTSAALFMVIQVWLPTYGQEMIGLDRIEAVGLLSFYSLGGFISVLLLTILLNKVIRPITIMIIYPSIALISLFVLLVFQYPMVIMVCSFLLGVSTSGVFQLAVALMTEFFPNKKGSSAASVSLSASIAYIVIPSGTGLLTKNVSISSVFIFDLVVAFVCILLALYISYRYRIVFNLHTKGSIRQKVFR